MSEKPKVAFYWCASCGGCEESIVDLAEGLLDVIEKVDIVFWPVAMDFKTSDVEAMADKSIFASFINGCIRTSEQEEMAHLLRKKSKVVVAYGSCAHTGGIPGLANQFAREQILTYVYDEAPTVTNENKVRPEVEHRMNGASVTLPAFRNVVRTLDQVIDVDYYIPGCAPTPKIAQEALQILLSGELPPNATVLAPDIALCDQCPRKDSKPEEFEYHGFKRPQWTDIDPEKCFLAQEIFCMGPATRGGCESLCIGGNMPCTGCFGPTCRVKDQGAKILSSICSALSAKDKDEIEKILDSIPDPLGTFYRYGLAGSLLRRNVKLPVS